MIGIFGGTFDPVHIGHLRLATEVAETLGLSRVHLVPAAIPPHRGEPLLDPTTRLDLVARSIADEPRFVLDDREHRRVGPSYTADTLAEFAAEFPGEPLVLMMGMDAFNGLPGWHEVERILDLAHIAVATRPGSQAEGKAAEWLAERRVDPAMLAHASADAPVGRIVPVAITRLDISATTLRGFIDQGRSLRYLVPEPVVRHFSRG
ncbi:nicotinate-nucleotide adenylyltransferase [Guyparkeria halophila]|uniref:Probable nicotinate-nucleotide adenylyltransferase n=1 Tax=Guyparkeria halophila TaxID=47960 RepID=A0ABZ0YX31_9GAMM|nr:nicotinate-nucleotide adenylyltransferase [Guyparkeria halophila]WQH15755.1 nicotinate-nucleotide adenylyltransferase [Guyparkeria halophila]